MIDTNNGKCPSCEKLLVLKPNWDLAYVTVEDYVADREKLYGHNMPYREKNGVRIPVRVCELCGSTIEEEK